MRVLVTGGSGTLGSLVTADLRRRGHEARPASRRTGVDLTSGRGLAEAVAGVDAAGRVDAVVHCASRPQQARAVDVAGTEHLAAAVAAQPEPPHVVYISIVGCDANPLGYYRAKATAEQALARSGVPATVVRATQFHSLAAAVARRLSIGPLVFTPGDLAVQPVDATWVASRLVDVATGVRPSGFARATDLAGPDLLTLAQVAGALREHAGSRPPRAVRLPAVGGVLRSLSAGSNLPGPQVEVGGRTFAEWLAAAGAGA